LIDIDSSELTDGYPYVVVKMSDPEASTIVSGVAVLSDSRYGSENTPTAIS
jgi:hypothetical protein